MGETPAPSGLAARFQPMLELDNTKSLKLTSMGPKYLVMARKQSDINSSPTLENVSPFLIKKAIDNVCNGEVDLCKKLKNGTVLIKTKNITQAQKLIKLCSLTPTIKVEISEHNSLNFVKGVIYSNDLRDIPAEIIVEELKQQNVHKVDKILKKINNELVETGLVILTFVLPSLPSEIAIGYEKVRVRTYIPRPLRCNNCFFYGHTAKVCIKTKICPNCSEASHIDSLSGEQCSNNKNCINCKLNNCDSFDHSVYDKSCPVFLKEKEIQSIISLEKLNRREALTKFNERNPHHALSYANITRYNNNNETNTTSTQNSNTQNASNSSNNSTRQTIDYSAICTTLTNESPTKIDSPRTSNKATILPRSTSKRTRQRMKQANKLNKLKKVNSSSMDFESADDTSLDLSTH